MRSPRLSKTRSLRRWTESLRRSKERKMAAPRRRRRMMVSRERKRERSGKMGVPSMCHSLLFVFPSNIAYSSTFPYNRAMQIRIPLNVPRQKREVYERNYRMATHNTGRLFVFAGDQKVEHLNDDFYGPSIAEDDQDPEHLFRIASKAKIGAFATQLGLIARYGEDYRSIPYLIKMNSKTHLVGKDQMDPLSLAWYTIEELEGFMEESGLTILGLGYTIYPGSEFEAQMFREAACLIYEAHRRGLIFVLWAYPRGKAVSEERDPHLIAGACGLALCLGADFVKVNPPSESYGDPEVTLREAVRAAGRTRVICAGGRETAASDFLARLYRQIHEGGVAGAAIGRNIHQRPLEEAIRFSDAISAIIYKDATVEEAMKIYEGASSL